ncbi:MAG: hypothetical protein CME98_24460, partial [Hyphomonas sp.]|nr:hypothetical protein [Hyphomonas sp.]
MLKKGSKDPVVQGGVDNYLGKQPQVVAPRKWQSGPDKPPTELAYITEAEKKLLLKEDIHGSLKEGPNKGPAGIISLDSFGDIGGAGAAGGDTEASGGAKEGKGFSGRGPTETKSDFENRVRNQKEIFQAAERRQARDLGIRERKNVIDMRRPGRLGFNPLATLLGFVNPFLGLAARGITSIPNVAKKFKSSDTLADFFSKVRGPKNITTDDDDTTLLDQVDPNLPFARSYLQQLQNKMPTNLNDYEGLTNLDFIDRISERDMSLTPKQQQLIEDKNYDEQVGDIRDIMADGGMIGGGIMDAAGRQQYFLGKLVKKAKRAVKKIVKSPIGKIGLGALALKLGGGFAADGFLRKTLLPKLISDGKLTGLGKLGLGAAISAAPLLFQQEEEQEQGLSSTGVGPNIDIEAIRRNPFAFQAPGIAGSRFAFAEGGLMRSEYDEAGAVMSKGEMEKLAKSPLYKGFKKMYNVDPSMAKGNESYKDKFSMFEQLIKKGYQKGGDVEPVAKKTMPLLDMGGQEMDLRAEGG